MQSLLTMLDSPPAAYAIGVPAIMLRVVEAATRSCRASGPIAFRWCRLEQNVK